MSEPVISERDREAARNALYEYATSRADLDAKIEREFQRRAH